MTSTEPKLVHLWAHLVCRAPVESLPTPPLVCLMSPVGRIWLDVPTPFLPPALCFLAPLAWWQCSGMRSRREGPILVSSHCIHCDSYCSSLRGQAALLPASLCATITPALGGGHMPPGIALSRPCRLAPHGAVPGPEGWASCTPGSSLTTPITFPTDLSEG